MGVRHGRWREWVDTGELLLDGVYCDGKPDTGLFLSRQLGHSLRLVEIREGRPWRGRFLDVVYRDGRKWGGRGSRVDAATGRRVDVYYWEDEAVDRATYTERREERDRKNFRCLSSVRVD